MTRFGLWEVECMPADGARLSRLRLEGQDLLTTAPAAFRPPKADYGRYETRPVYGYDDCLPSVDACPFPGLKWTIPDHGELCWLKWHVEEEKNTLRCSVRSGRLPLTFTRVMHFSARELRWTFEVRNHGERKLPFQHVMHPLMPLDQIAGFELPKFSSVFDERTKQSLRVADVESYLLHQPRGTASMLLVHGVAAGKMMLMFRRGLRLTVTFPLEWFPTIGIWWNNTGYPDEDGCRRNECAFEPIPGPTSSLKDGTTMKMASHGSLKWQVRWGVH